LGIELDLEQRQHVQRPVARRELLVRPPMLGVDAEGRGEGVVEHACLDVVAEAAEHGDQLGATRTEGALVVSADERVPEVERDRVDAARAVAHRNVGTAQRTTPSARAASAAARATSGATRLSNTEGMMWWGASSSSPTADAIASAAASF